MFIALMVLPQPPAEDTMDFLRRRARRLLWPWLVWSAIFGLALVLWHRGWPGWPQNWALWFVGPSLHLWFLPFAFACAVLVHAVERPLPKSLLCSLLLVVSALISVVCFDALHLKAPFGQWAYGLAAAWLTLAYRQLPGEVGQGPRLAGIGALAVVGASYVGLAPAVTALVLGVSMAFLGTMVHRPHASWMTVLGPLSFLVYLSHLLFFVLAGHFLGFQNQPALAIATLVATLVGCLFLIRLRLERVLL